MNAAGLATVSVAVGAGLAPICAHGSPPIATHTIEGARTTSLYAGDFGFRMAFNVLGSIPEALAIPDLIDLFEGVVIEPDDVGVVFSTDASLDDDFNAAMVAMRRNPYRNWVLQENVSEDGTSRAVGGGGIGPVEGLGAQPIDRLEFAFTRLDIGPGEPPSQVLPGVDSFDYEGVTLTRIDYEIELRFFGDPEPLAADINADGVVDLFDFNIFAREYGVVNPNLERGDFNGDGLINLIDFDILARQFTPASGVSAIVSPIAIPEPASAALLALACPLVTRRRRRR